MEAQSAKKLSVDNTSLSARKDGVAQSGLRHAIALEKLIQSKDSQDSALKNLKEMHESKDSGLYNPNQSGDSFAG